MAELHGSSKLPPKQRKPSGLRHEIRPELTDDEGARQESVVEVPCSDNIVPETQAEEAQHVTDSSVFDPVDVALLERNKATTSLPFKIKLLSKANIFGKGGRSASPDEPEFFFKPTKTPLGKVALKEAGATTEPSSVIPNFPPVEYTSNGRSAIAYTDRSPLGAPDHVRRGLSNTTSAQDTGNMSSCYVGGAVYHDTEAHRTEIRLSEGSPSIQSSAQPRIQSHSGRPNIRAIKKKTTSKRSGHSQQRAGPWPPRPREVAQHANEATSMHQIAPEILADPHDLSSVGSQDGQPSHPPEEPVQATLLSRAHEEQIQSHTIRPFQEVSRATVDDGMNVCRHTQHTSPPIPRGQLDTSADRVLEESLEQGHPTASLLISAAKPDLVTQTVNDTSIVLPQKDVFPNGPITRPRNVIDHDALRASQAIDGVLAFADQMSLPHAEPDGGCVSPQRESEGVLHEVSDQGRPSRVAKPRKKVRIPPLHPISATSISSGTGRAMESLRMALLADELRAEHERTTTMKQHEETAAVLKNMVALQTQIIADEKKKHQNLSVDLVRLTEKAKTNQKYVTGLQNDYEKLQKSAISFRNQNEKILREEIMELEKEKAALRREFEAMIEAVTRNQRNSSSTAKDLYQKFTLSESRRIDLLSNSNKLAALCREERKRREILEEHLIKSVQDLQRQFGTTSASLVDKFEGLQTSIGNIAADDCQKTQITECLAILRQFQSTPFLTTSDVHGAEGMLRFLRKSVDAGLSTISKTLSSQALPKDEIRAFIEPQLQKLQTEMMKYDEVAMDNRKMRDSNKTLENQLEVLKQRFVSLEDQVNASELAKAELESRSTELQRELSDYRQTARISQPELPENGREMKELREKLAELQVNLETMNAERKKTEQARDALEREANTYKSRYEGAKAGLRRFDEEAKLAKKTESATEMREKIMKECQMEFREKESDFKNDVHRLTVERNEREETLQTLQVEMQAAKDQLQKLRKSTRDLESTLHAMQKEQVGTTAELQLTQERLSAKSQSLAGLEERLQKMAEDLRMTTEANSDLVHQQEISKKAQMDLQAVREELQSQVSQHPATIEALHRDAQRQMSIFKAEAQTTLASTQNKASRLERENNDLASKLKQFRANEVSLKNRETTLSDEKVALQGKLAVVEGQLKAARKDILRAQVNTADEKRVLTESHRREMDDLRDRFAQTDKALNEAQAKLRLREDEHRAKIEADRKVAESKLLEVKQHFQKLLREAETRSSSRNLQPSQESVTASLRPESLQDLPPGKTRKKVSRENQSVFNMGGPSKPQNEAVTRASVQDAQGLVRPQREEPEHYFSLFEEGVESQELVDRIPEQIPETQQFMPFMMSPETFDKSLAQVSQKEAERQNTSSTELTNIGSDEMTQLQQDIQPQPTLRGYDHSSPYLNPVQKEDGGPEMPLDDISSAGSQSFRSQDRPRSQANTASRMMPPPDTGSKNSSRKIMKHFGTSDDMDRIMGNSRTSPNMTSPPLPVSKRTYGQHEARSAAHVPMQRNIQYEVNEKRKTSASRIETDTAYKKQRTSAQSYPAEAMSSSRSNTQLEAPRSTTLSSAESRTSSRVKPRSSSQTTTSNGLNSSRRQQPASSQVRGSSSTGLAASRSLRSKTCKGGDAAIDDRFSQELRDR